MLRRQVGQMASRGIETQRQAVAQLIRDFWSGIFRFLDKSDLNLTDKLYIYIYKPSRLYSFI